MVSLLIGGRNPSWILRRCCRHGLLLVSRLYSRHLLWTSVGSAVMSFFLYLDSSGVTPSLAEC